MAGNGVCHYVRAGRPHCMLHGGNDYAERCVKTPRVKGGTPSHATRDQPFKTRVSPVLSRRLEKTGTLL